MSSARVSSLTLIVAVTPSLGIGRAGSLPWPHIKSEMAYFARVTKRVGSSADPAPSTPVSDMSNAVVMGRKTWESIPAKFRPLPGRINVVLTRSPSSLALDDSLHADTLTASSFQEGLEQLGTRYGGKLGRVFVIGGAQVYAEALRAKEAERVLLTKIKQDYECDTFFPIEFGSENGDAKAWTKESKAVRDEWLGEQDPHGKEWAVEMWVKTRVTEELR